MGGKLFNTERIDTLRYKQIEEDVLNLLWIHFGKDGKVPDSFKRKDSWGDLDVILPFPLLDVKRILSVFQIKPEHYSLNTYVASILFQGFQVDLIHVEPDFLQSSFNYYRQGDTGNLIGRIYHNLGLKFGHKGLLLPVKLSADEVLGEVFVFPIPLDDLGEATVNLREKSVILMRYIRKAINEGTMVKDI